MFKPGQLNGFLENFKETMEEGDENLGIPVLEPFVRKHLDIDLSKRRLFSYAYVSCINYGKRIKWH